MRLHRIRLTNFRGVEDREVEFATSGVTIIEADAPHQVTLLDCTQHLDALAADDAHALSGG